MDKYVTWTNVAWSNGTGSLVNSQGWFHKLEMSSTVLSYQLSELEMEFHVMEKVYAALRMCTCAEKMTF